MDEQSIQEQEETGVEETGGPEPDPFAEVPSDPIAADGEPLPPPPPEGGHIPVSEPSEEQRAAEAETQRLAEEAERMAAEAGDGEFLEEPPETDDPPPAAEALPEDPPPAPEEPIEESAPEPIPAEGEPTPDAEPEPAPMPEPEAEGQAAEDETPTQVEASESPPTGGIPASAEEAEEPKAEEKPKPKAKRKRRRKKDLKGHRGYVILRASDAALPGAATTQPVWEEAFPREIPLGEDGSHPVVMESRTAEMALRAAYRVLTDNGEGSFDLVAVPVKMFRPQRVEGKVPETALAIKIG